MNTNAKSVQTYELRLWSKKYYGKALTEANIYDGTITDCKTKKQIHFHTPADLMKAIENMYKKAEKNKD